MLQAEVKQDQVIICAVDPGLGFAQVGREFAGELRPRHRLNDRRSQLRRIFDDKQFHGLLSLPAWRIRREGERDRIRSRRATRVPLRIASLSLSLQRRD